MRQPRLSYAICTAPRTGSTLLSAALARTGVAGQPAEYFDIYQRNEAHWRQHLNIRDNAEYISRLVETTTTPNGVFGFKVHCHQTPALIAKLRADRVARGLQDVEAPVGSMDIIHPLLRARLGEIRYVWLRRQDKVAQAISYYRAGKTDRWRVPVGAEPPADPAVPYDYDAIHKLVLNVERFDQAWYQFFMRQRLPALILVYEEFIRNYETTVRGLLAYLDLKDPTLPVVAPVYQKQADASSADWAQRYREQLQAAIAAPRYVPTKKKAARTPAAAKPRKGRARATLPLIAYDLRSGIEMAIEPAPPTRPWMDEIPQRVAYRCLPLLIANQAGWMIRNPSRLRATWDGSVGTGGLRVEFDDPAIRPYAASHFGSGILTFNIGCLFRTPPGYNMQVRGPTNWPKDGIAALDGIVETDWSRATFTMNWKLTRPGHTVVFEAGEPIAMIAPVARGEIERFRPEFRALHSEPDLEQEYKAWSQSRRGFNAALQAGDPEAIAAGWQRHYVLGMTVTEQDAPEHQTALTLAPFVDARKPDP